MPLIRTFGILSLVLQLEYLLLKIGFQSTYDLYVVDGVVIMKRRIVIPQALRSEVLQSLHFAYQGVTTMNERTKTEIYWSGITFEAVRDNCVDWNHQKDRFSPMEPCIPTTPFEALTCDYFLLKGWNYLVAADRASLKSETFCV